MRRLVAAAIFIATPAMAAPPRLVIPQVGAPIRCDGELDEVAWRTPARTGPFTDAAGNIASPYSEARMLRDDDELYLGLYAADEDVRTTDAFVVELSSPRGHVTLRFSADGRAVPAKLHARSAIDVDGSVNAPGDDDEEWLVEAAVPLSAIPFAADGSVTAAITRCDVTKDGVRRCGSWRGVLVRR